MIQQKTNTMWKEKYRSQKTSNAFRYYLFVTMFAISTGIIYTKNMQSKIFILEMVFWNFLRLIKYFIVK